MNSVQLIGRTTKDPELKSSQSGKPVISFTLAVPKKFKKDEADFIRCRAWKKTAELISQYISKGDRIGVEGSITTYTYDKNGQKAELTEVSVERIEFLSEKRGDTKTDIVVENNEEDLPF